MVSEDFLDPKKMAVASHDLKMVENIKESFIVKCLRICLFR